MLTATGLRLGIGASSHESSQTIGGYFPNKETKAQNSQT